MILLASGSARRAELLRQIRVSFEQRSLDIDESSVPGERPADYVERLAREKAEAGWRYHAPDRGFVAAIGADTTVTLNGLILGKPDDASRHLQMMNALGGLEHEVLSAVALTNGARTDVRVVVSRVRLRRLSEAEAASYWATGEPLDKAGGYAIQGLGGVFVEHIQGSYSAVVGLPLLETAELLADFGVSYWLQDEASE